jgi:hypothetical protein
VNPPRCATERFDASRHDTSQFQSGNQALDHWLLRYAGQSERRDAARTFVITDAGVVISYYALLAGELDYGLREAGTRYRSEQVIRFGERGDRASTCQRRALIIASATYRP